MTIEGCDWSEEFFGRSLVNTGFRDVRFNTTAAGLPEEEQKYPVVIGIDYDFQAEETRLILDVDRRRGGS